jgi:hypothetical protein
MSPFRASSMKWSCRCPSSWCESVPPGAFELGVHTGSGRETVPVESRSGCWAQTAELRARLTAVQQKTRIGANMGNGAATHRVMHRMRINASEH